MTEQLERTRVRIEMWKSLCCHHRTAKVQDEVPAANGSAPPVEAAAAVAEKKEEVRVVSAQPGPTSTGKIETVVVYVSYDVLSRGLLGQLVHNFEKKQLKLTEMEMRVVPRAQLEKFAKFGRKYVYDEKKPSLTVALVGEDCLRRVADTCSDFGKENALTRYDVVWSASAANGKKDIASFFPPKTTFEIPPSPMGPPPEAAPVVVTTEPVVENEGEIVAEDLPPVETTTEAQPAA